MVFCLTFGAGTVGFGDFEQVGGGRFGPWRCAGRRGRRRGQRECREIEGEGTADGAFGEAGDESALGGLEGGVREFGAALGEKVFDLFGGDRAEAEDGGSGSGWWGRARRDSPRG